MWVLTLMSEHYSVCPLKYAVQVLLKNGGNGHGVGRET